MDEQLFGRRHPEVSLSLNNLAVVLAERVLDRQPHHLSCKRNLTALDRA
jgi:hypothetical protein